MSSIVRPRWVRSARSRPPTRTQIERPPTAVGKPRTTRLIMIPLEQQRTVRDQPAGRIPLVWRNECEFPQCVQRPTTPHPLAMAATTSLVRCRKELSEQPAKLIPTRPNGPGPCGGKCATIRRARSHHRLWKWPKRPQDLRTTAKIVRLPWRAALVETSPGEPVACKRLSSNDARTAGHTPASPARLGAP